MNIPHHVMALQGHPAALRQTEVPRKPVFMQELSGDIANFGSQKEQRTKAAQGKLKAAKAGLEASKKAAKEAGQALTQAAAEAEAATTERQSLTEQLQSAQKAVQGTAWILCPD